MITVRKPEFQFDQNAPSYWYDDNKFVSCFLSALSITFPAGEKFFITAVRDCMTSDMDESLKADIKAFIAQEGQHSLRHIDFNHWLQRKGYRALELESVVKWFLAQVSKLPRKDRLALTCALEHITALMAERLIDEADIFAEPIDPAFREFWKWHAMEEFEHKSVAFDVYRTNDYDEFTRLSAAVFATIGLMIAVTIGHAWLSWTKKGWRGAFDIAKGLNTLYGPRGFITRSIPAYLHYYKIGFHPTDRD